MTEWKCEWQTEKTVNRNSHNLFLRHYSSTYWKDWIYLVSGLDMEPRTSQIWNRNTNHLILESSLVLFQHCSEYVMYGILFENSSCFFRFWSPQYIYDCFICSNLICSRGTDDFFCLVLISAWPQEYNERIRINFWSHKITVLTYSSSEASIKGAELDKRLW
jgi:hypothetical protein